MVSQKDKWHFNMTCVTMETQTKYEDQSAEGLNHNLCNHNKSTIQISMSINSQWLKHQFGTKGNLKGNVYKAQQGSYMIQTIVMNLAQNSYKTWDMSIAYLFRWESQREVVGWEPDHLSRSEMRMRSVSLVCVEFLSSDCSLEINVCAISKVCLIFAYPLVNCQYPRWFSAPQEERWLIT